MELPTVPCATCGQPTTYTGTKRCNNCHEVETRIVSYASSANGRRHLFQVLRTIDVEALKRWIGKERTRFDRIQAEAKGATAERAFGESNVCSLIIGKINERLRELRDE